MEEKKEGSSETRAKNKYNAKNYDRVTLSVPKGKKEEYKEAAMAEGKSLNQFAVDKIEGKDSSPTAYTREIAERLGGAYQGILEVMSKKRKIVHDPYPDSSYIFPMRCLMMLLPRAMSLGVPDELNDKIMVLMNSITLEDMDRLMRQPMPQEFVLNFERGKMKRTLKWNKNDSCTMITKEE